MSVRIDRPELNPQDLPVRLYLQLDSLARTAIDTFKTDNTESFSTAMERLEEFLDSNKPKLNLAGCVASRMTIPLDPDQHGIPH